MDDAVCGWLSECGFYWVNHGKVSPKERCVSIEVVGIGASTGGTGAIENILTTLPTNIPVPVVITQHIPQAFLTTFVSRLDDMLAINSNSN